MKVQRPGKITILVVEAKLRKQFVKAFDSKAYCKITMLAKVFNTQLTNCIDSHPEKLITFWKSHGNDSISLAKWG